MKMSAFRLTEQSPRVAHATVMPNLVPYVSTKYNAHTAGEVLSHPEDFPIEVRNTVPWKTWLATLRGTVESAVVLRFFAGDPLLIGSYLRITIPLRHKNNHFEAKVAQVKRLRIGYETWVTIPARQDAERLRVVERICALECELQRALKEAAH